MSALLRRTIIAASILLPVLTAVLVLLHLSEQAAAVTLKDPQKYPYSFQTIFTGIDSPISAYPFFVSDTTSVPVRLEIGNDAPDRSWVYIHDIETRDVLPPCWNTTDSTVRISPPIIARGADGYAEIVLFLHFGERPARLLYFKHFEGRDWRRVRGAGHYFSAHIVEDPSATPQPGDWGSRIFENEFNDPGYFDHEGRIFFLEDLNPAEPGLEVFVSLYWEHRDTRKNRYQIRMYNLATWKELWRYELAADVKSIEAIREDGRLAGIFVLTGSPHIGITANGMDDWHHWLLKLDLSGELLAPPTTFVRGENQWTEQRLLLVPDHPELFIITSRDVTGSNPINDFIEVRSVANYEIIDSTQTVGFSSVLMAPVPGDSRSMCYILGDDEDERFVLYNDKLEIAGSLDLGEAAWVIGSIPNAHHLPGKMLGPCFVLGTTSGRLVLVNDRMKILSADVIAEGPLYGVFRDYSLGGERYWILNSQAGSFTGYWVKRSQLLYYSVVSGIATLFAWMLLYVFVLYRRWRFQRAAVDALFRHSPEAILILDSQDRIRAMNERFRCLLRHTGGTDSGPNPELAGGPHRGVTRRQHLQNLALPDLLKPLFQRVFANGETSGTVDLLEDNQPVSFQFRLDSMRSGGSRYGRALILQDITHHLERTRRTIWSFMAQNTAHRLKSPLQRIRFAAENALIRLRKGHLERERMESSHRAVLDTALEIDQIIHEFLELSERRVKPRPLDPSRFLLKNVQRYRERNLGSDVVLALDLEEGLPHIQADEYHLLTVLVNLLDNSLKAVQGEGRIDVGARVVADSGDEPRRMLRISVRDDGVGIKTEDLPRIFQHQESFFRNGHGIGLAVVYNIVTAHEGRISVESEEGVGTSFYVDLPLASNRS